MKAIETVYRGYRFRSRLEARWAVFFDELGLKWEYEPEGFELPSGRYLPDFFVRCHESSSVFRRYGAESGYWVEVKAGTPTEHECRLAGDLNLATKHNVFIVTRLPADGQLYSSSTGLPARPYLGPEDFSPEYQLWLSDFVMDGTDRAESIDTLSSRFDVAVTGARQARFEHGQRGAPSQWLRA